MSFDGIGRFLLNLGRVIKAWLKDLTGVGTVLWCPFATTPEDYGLSGGDMKTGGNYPLGYPKGAVVHYTAGPSLESAYNTAIRRGFTYFIIAKDGVILQSFPLSRWGSHAGKSWWKGLGESVSKQLVGIEVVCWGQLKYEGYGRYKTWRGDFISEYNVRAKGVKYFEKFTPAQELSLVRLLKWLKKNNKKVFDTELVLGHEEVSPGRKVDPGLSMASTMPALRMKLG